MNSVEFNQILKELKEYMGQKDYDVDVAIKMIDLAIKRLDLDESKEEMDNTINDTNKKIDSLILQNKEMFFDDLLKVNNDKLRRILSYIGEEPKFISNEVRLLSKDEVLGYRTNLGINKEDIIPLIDIYNNEIIIYDIKSDTFMIMDMSTEDCRSLESIDKYLDLLAN